MCVTEAGEIHGLHGSVGNGKEGEFTEHPLTEVMKNIWNFPCMEVFNLMMSFHVLVFFPSQEKKMLERRAAELEEELKVRAHDHGRLVLIGSFSQL